MPVGYDQSKRSELLQRINDDRTAVECKAASNERDPRAMDALRVMFETMANHYEEKALFNQMIDDVAEGCISTIVERSAIHEIEKQFERFVRENGIQSFDELESERTFELIEGDDGSITYRVMQQYRKKQPEQKK